MSRSYKKFIVYKEENSKFCKRMASRAVRRCGVVTKGSGYKKYYCSWDICDWWQKEKFYTAEQFRRKWFDTTDNEFDYERRRFRNWKEAYRHWLKMHRSK